MSKQAIQERKIPDTREVILPGEEEEFRHIRDAGERIQLPLYRRLVSRKVEEGRFLSVALDPHRLEPLLESLVWGQHLKARHPNLRMAILTLPENETIVRSAGVYDEIHFPGEEKSLRARIRELKPSAVFLPHHGLSEDLSLFSLFRVIKISTGSVRPLSRLFSVFHLDRAGDLLLLKKKGLDLSMAPSSLRIDPSILSRPRTLSAGPYIWLSLLETSQLEIAWSLNHAARLMRLLDSRGIKVVLPVPVRADKERQKGLVKALQYLRSSVPGLQLFEYDSVEKKAAGMIHADLVVSPSGSEVLMASLLGRPCVVLHDRTTYRRHQQSAFTGEISGFEKLHHMLRRVEVRHLSPVLDECASDCHECPRGGCVDTISPERVFETIRKIILPLP